MLVAPTLCTSQQSLLQTVPQFTHRDIRPAFLKTEVSCFFVAVLEGLFPLPFPFPSRARTRKTPSWEKSVSTGIPLRT